MFITETIPFCTCKNLKISNNLSLLETFTCVILRTFQEIEVRCSVSKSDCCSCSKALKELNGFGGLVILQNWLHAYMHHDASFGLHHDASVVFL